MWQEIKDKEQWNNLVASQTQSSFLQSWQWGEFQESLGRKVARLSWEDKSIAQAIKMPLWLGKFYWYVPRGPIILNDDTDITEPLAELKHKLSGGLFLRVDSFYTTPFPLPVSSTGQALKEEGSSLCQVPSVQAQCTRILDLRLSSNELLASMHPKTRYNINLAQKKGVAVGEGGLDDFLRLNRATRVRDKFKSHPDYYYKKMTETLDNDFLKIWQTAYQDKILASAIIIYFGDTVTYVHGASSDEQREVMAPHFLHWQILKDAQPRGYRFYDLGGVNPEDQSHPAYKKSWSGISRFKAGFGGAAVCYPDSFDLIYRKKWYIVYRLAKFITQLL